MPWILQMVWFFCLLLGLAVLFWVGFWFFLALMLVAFILINLERLKLYLIAKGILNPQPGVPPGESLNEGVSMTVIDGEFERLEASVETPEDTKE